ncbi:MAG: efflux RND transporter periplasmic adaptor subunit [Bacteroidia bacterium]
MKIKTIVLIVLLVGSLLALKYFLFPSKNTSAGGAPIQQSKGVASAITAYVVKTEKLQNSVYASGTVLANEEVDLKPELAGKIVQLNIDEGASVSKGQLLVKINDAEFQAQLKKLQLENALAETQLKRELELLKINGVSQQDVDISQNKLNGIKADIEYIQSQISKTEIRAPFNGVIGLKNVSEGAYITTATIIATIQQINPIKLDFSVSERYFDLVKKGRKVVFTIDGINKSFVGEVFAVEPKIDLATRTLKVRAICANNQGVIYPGAYVRVKLELGAIDNAMMIPTEAVIPDLKGKKVIRVKKGKADFVKVETGLRTDVSIQITSGLDLGDTVVTTGLMQLKQDTSVKIKEIK